VDVGEDVFAVVSDADDGFEIGFAFRAGRAIRPEKNFRAGLNGVGRGGEKEENRETR
jgi:hypothetical protein